MDADTEQFRWQRSAACLGAPSYIFFPDEMEHPGFREDEKFKGKTAKDFCEGCPVRAICEEFALLHDESGIWGNTKTGQRAKNHPTGERREMRAMKAESGKYKRLYGEGETPNAEDFDWAC